MFLSPYGLSLDSVWKEVFPHCKDAPVQSFKSQLHVGARKWPMGKSNADWLIGVPKWGREGQWLSPVR